MHYDVVIIGAGAAGLMCAIEAGKRGRSVLLLDHAKNIGEKIRISGGGRCNFTNLHATAENYLSQNPRFCISALKRYTQHDFIALVSKHGIAYHEKTLGQLFCDGSAKEIIAMLKGECDAAGVTIMLETHIKGVSRHTDAESFAVETSNSTFSTTSLVVASGGLSIPKMGATGIGYDIAKQFDIPITPTRAALVPFIFHDAMLHYVKQLAGISLNVTATCNGTTFKEGMLFTHRGLSGPSILQISSYWEKGANVHINLAPEHDIYALLLEEKRTHPKQKPLSTLTRILPKRLAACLCENEVYDAKLAELSNSTLTALANSVNRWVISPPDTEGYRTAEVTIGGVDTRALSAKTLESNNVKGLYFIGEVVDVTGHLGGFNFQWAWASGHAAGQYV